MVLESSRGAAAERTRDQDAGAGTLAAADPTAKLVKLREPEALRMLDDHQRGCRDVDPHLDHGRRNEDLTLTPLEALHDRPALPRLQASVHDVHLALGKRPGDSFGRLDGRAQIGPLALLDERVNHVGLLASCHRLLDQL